jgi:hypothetical protein
MKFAVWDGYDAYGLSASDWKKSFPTPAGGKLLFILKDDGTLQAAQQYAPGGGRVPITDKNLKDVQAAYKAMYDPAPDAPAPSELTDIQATLAWVVAQLTGVQ